MKKILFVSHINPFSASFGAEQRSSVFLTAFLQNDCSVDIAYIGKESIKTIPDNPHMSLVFNGVTGYHPSILSRILFKLCLKPFLTCQHLKKTIDKLLSNCHYDYIACRYVDVAELAGLRKYRSRVILDIDDLPHQSYRASLKSESLFQKRTNEIRLKRIESLTKKWIKSAHVCFLPNKQLADEYQTAYFPNIPIVHADKFVDYGQSLLFIGKLDWKPNYEGLMHFIEKCWGDIIASCPNAKFYIGGKGLPEGLKQAISKYRNVELLGFVPNIYDFYSRGNIVIVPIYSGSGTNIKVVEAMSMAKACVVTPFATRGFEHVLQDGNNIVIANDDSEIEKEIISLMTDKDKVAQIATNAVRSIDTEYSQTFVNRTIKDCL